jgi:hypothetical protein
MVKAGLPPVVEIVLFMNNRIGRPPPDSLMGYDRDYIDLTHCLQKHGYYRPSRYSYGSRSYPSNLPADIHACANGNAAAPYAATSHGKGTGGNHMPAQAALPTWVTYASNDGADGRRRFHATLQAQSNPGDTAPPALLSLQSTGQSTGAGDGIAIVKIIITAAQCAAIDKITARFDNAEPENFAASAVAGPDSCIITVQDFAKFRDNVVNGQILLLTPLTGPHNLTPISFPIAGLSWDDS